MVADCPIGGAYDMFQSFGILEVGRKCNLSYVLRTV